MMMNPPAEVVKNEGAMVYLPLLPNEKAVKDFDPSTAKFRGAVWTEELVEMLVNRSVLT
jgi:phospholipase A2